MLKTIIVDDEEPSRIVLRTLLARYCPDIKFSGEAKSVKEALALISEKKPDLVFLDVEMHGGSGFDLLEKAGEINFSVIFTTAFNKYALKAIKFSAMDYLLKPINIEELVKAVKKAESARENAEAKTKLNFFLQNYKNTSGTSRIAIHTKDGLELITLKDIIRCEADGKYTWLVLLNGKKIISVKNLKEFEELLSDYNFFRVHHSHLVNMEHIKYYLKGEGGILMMCNDERVFVSKRKKDEFLNLLNKV